MKYIVILVKTRILFTKSATVGPQVLYRRCNTVCCRDASDASGLVFDSQYRLSALYSAVFGLKSELQNRRLDGA